MLHRLVRQCCRLSPSRLPRSTPFTQSAKYWTAPRNATEWYRFVKELINGGSAIALLRLQLLAPTLSGAYIDVHSSPPTQGWRYNNANHRAGRGSSTRMRS